LALESILQYSSDVTNLALKLELNSS